MCLFSLTVIEYNVKRHYKQKHSFKSRAGSEQAFVVTHLCRRYLSKEVPPESHRYNVPGKEARNNVTW